ncbi:hypothetical protein CDD82_590 [Ophiocordyceps australis]|uniref:Sec20 C-terminal domain-containing protein n=1 Tax=Ophiocordyceps australis TaxID=1399860 RepID=A0A2C5YN04_9HYPO|nr:hypothetical protein CDD82_590 [Ophiocordyceps australis]
MSLLESTSTRLTALQESTLHVETLIDRLVKLEYQPGSVPLGTEEDDSLRAELIAETVQVLRNAQEELELISAELGFLEPGHDKERLTEGVERLGAHLVRHRRAFCKARITAKKAFEDAQIEERRLRIMSFTPSEPVSPVPTDQAPAATAPPRRHLRTSHTLDQTSLSEKDRQVVGASGNVTDALRRMHDLVASELSRSDFAHQTLEESSATLQHLGESYSSLDTMLASSRDLLGTLLRSEKSDTWYLQTAFYTLLVTGAWLVFRRLLYGPTWWLVWLPLRILFGLGSKIGGAMMLRAGNGSVKAQTTIPHETLATVQGLPDDELPTLDAKPDDDYSQQVEEIDAMIQKVNEVMMDSAQEAFEVENSEGSELDGLDDEPTEWQDDQSHGQNLGDAAQVRDEL